MINIVETMIALVVLYILMEEVTAMSRPVCPHETGERCKAAGRGFNEYNYIVDGRFINVEFVDGGFFYLKFTEGLTLENSALPRFETVLRVENITLRGCAPPATSYKEVLAAVNVSVVALRELRLMDTPSVSPILASHLAEMPLEVLKVYGSSPLELAPDFLTEMPELRALIVYNARLPAAALELLPVRLESLLLTNAGVERVPAAVFARLPRLVELTVRSRHAIAVEGGAAAALRSLSLDAPGASAPGAARPPNLERLVLRRSVEPEPAPWDGCERLLELRVLNSAVRVLPVRWIAACPRLALLTVSRAAMLTRIAPELLTDAVALTHLELSHTSLEVLPAGLLDGAPGLLSINLSGNRLHTLPSGIFSCCLSLQTLNLSNNLFTARVADSLQSLPSLRTLSLAGNALLGDLCSGGDSAISSISPLRSLHGLEELLLRGTGVAFVCRDWRVEMPRLRKLDLADTNITHLTYDDLQYFRGPDVRDASVDLTGANVTVVYSAKDYRVARDYAAPRPQVTIMLDSKPACDCTLYWTARAMRELPEHARVEGMQCARGDLARVPLDALTCPAPDLCGRLPAACRCAWREDGSARAPDVLVTVDCERGGLERPPAPLPANSTWRLLLSNNRISRLRAVDLPRDLRGLRELDLRDNGLESVDWDVAAALAAVPELSVRLAGNPLACDCAAEALLAAVRARPGAFDPDARCRDGRALVSLAPLQCQTAGPALAVTLGAVLAALVAAALTLVACLSRPDRRLWVKAVLHRWGWLPRAAEPDDGRRFDVFVSFSHHDTAFVSQLVARLETGRTPYRLCLHDRDWAPGEWIPAQIAASVRASRRTLAVVSQHFLRSKWARAEFREAHAFALRSATPRLVVVLLEAPTALPLDRELRTYLQRNTYVQWGDRWFWDKLLLAMPPPRVYNSTASAPAAPAPPASDPHTPAPAACRPFDRQAETPSSLQKSSPSPQNIPLSSSTQIVLPNSYSSSTVLEFPTSTQTVISSPIETLTTSYSALKLTIPSSPVLTQAESVPSSPASSRGESPDVLKIKNTDVPTSFAT